MIRVFLLGGYKMNGIANRRASLTGGTPLEITFADEDNIQNISLALMSDTATVAYKINDEITLVTDVDSNFLDGTIGVVTVNIYKPFEIRTLNVVSDLDCDIQWEIRK